MSMRLCSLLAIGAVFLVSVAFGSGGESTLLWWQKVLYAVAGGVAAIVVPRLLPSDEGVTDSANGDRSQPHV